MLAFRGIALIYLVQSVNHGCLNLLLCIATIASLCSPLCISNLWSPHVHYNSARMNVHIFSSTGLLPRCMHSTIDFSCNGISI